MGIERGYFDPPVNILIEERARIIEDSLSDTPTFNIDKKDLYVDKHIITPTGYEAMQLCEAEVFKNGHAVVRNTYRGTNNIYPNGKNYYEVRLPEDKETALFSIESEDGIHEILLVYLHYKPGESPVNPFV